MYKSKNNLWSKIFPGTDVIVSETIVECVNPSYGYNLLKYKIIRTTINQTSLKGLWRDKIRTIMQKLNINHTLESFKIPRCLMNYLMYLNIENSDHILEINFRAKDSLKSEFKEISEEGPIFNIKNKKSVEKPRL